MYKRFFLLLLLLCSFSFAVAAEPVDVLVFYGQGCAHCAAALNFLDQYNATDVQVAAYEVYFNQSSRDLLSALAATYNQSVQGVPTIFIGGKMIAGFDQPAIEQAIAVCAQTNCTNPLTVATPKAGAFKKLTIPAVLAAAAVDAINPCAFAVLIILITTILLSKNRKRALLAGLAFAAAIFISYYLMGVGLYSAIGAAGVGHVFFLIVALLAIIIGLFNLKDYLWYGKWFVMEVPLSWRPRLKGLIHRVVSVPGAFITGFAVSLFLLPCTSGPYIIILGLLAAVASRKYALLLLLLYNAIFVLPMVLITLAIYFGFTTAEQAEAWRQGKLEKLHLIAGIILLLLGLAMLFSVMFGMI